jgi:deoxyribonuclease-4
LTDKDVEKFAAAQKETGIDVVCAHDSYLINLASPDEALYNKSYHAFFEEMQRCDLLGIPTLVMHPGSHVGSGEDAGLKRIAEAFNRMFETDPDGSVTVCLETTAGQGTNLGYRFEHLAHIIDMVGNKDRMTVCLDTCHIFTAGYGISTKREYRATIKQFDDVIGLDRLRIIHVNDSRREAGSKVDRHAHIGEGEIGAEPFGYFLNDPKLKKIPKILETPKTSPADDRKNLKVLRSLITSKRKGMR